jgi:hypothetical protein
MLGFRSPSQKTLLPARSGSQCHEVVLPQFGQKWKRILKPRSASRILIGRLRIQNQFTRHRGKLIRFVLLVGFAVVLPSQSHGYCVNDPPGRICLHGDNQPRIVTPQEKAIADRCYDRLFTKLSKAEDWRWFQEWQPRLYALKPYVHECILRIMKTIDNHP